jgi:lipopolysaccharide export system protein LptA
LAFSSVKNRLVLFLPFLVLIVFSPFFSNAQKPTKVKLIKADDLMYDKALGDQVQRLIGDVILKHDSTYLYCDSAYLYEKTNSFKGFGNVRIKASDTLNIYSDLLDYEGNTKIAELKNNVRLEDPRATLYTDNLWYDRNAKVAYYLTGGKIVDTTNVLTSIKGHYYTDLKEAFFKEDVVLTNPKYVMNTDTMRYNTETEISTFLGPTTITSDENLIYCENGWYDTQNDKSFFKENAYIITKEQKLYGDSLFYDRQTDFGLAYSNVTIIDTIQNMIIKGDYGEFKKPAGYSFVTDSAMAIMVDKKDSLFLHSDTLWVFFDSLQNVEYMLGYYKAKFFRKDLQGMCDSIVYKFNDSTIFLYNGPVLWSDENQLTADSIRIALKGNQIDTLAMLGSAFIVSVDDTISQSTFNQVRGKTMVGRFRDNVLALVNVYGNAQSVFYVREDNGQLIGINTTSSSDMNIYLTDNEVRAISPIKNVDGHTFPPKDFPEEEKKLKGFNWNETSRPKNKEDIFLE